MASESDCGKRGFGWEVSREVAGAGAVAGGGPFGAALEGFVKTAAEHGVVGMAEGGVEDAALAIVDGQEIGLLLAIEIRHGGGEHGDVFSGTAKMAVKLILSMAPAGGKTAGDGVIGGLDFHHKLVLRPVGTAFARRGVAEEAAVFDVEPGAGFFIAPAPTTDADHAIVLGPGTKGIVGSMDGDKTTAIFDVVVEGGAHGFGPILAIVIADDDIVGGEVRPPGIPGRWC